VLDELLVLDVVVVDDVVVGGSVLGGVSGSSAAVLATNAAGKMTATKRKP
jgi:hypothetical protein